MNRELGETRQTIQGARDEIGLIGVNHKIAPVELREPLSLKHINKEPLSILSKVDGVREIMFLSTCNRAEILFTSPCIKETLPVLRSRWCNEAKVEPNETMDSFYEYINDEAVRHLFLVASSLDSMIVGEPQILGQLKDAYKQASSEKYTGIILNRLLHKAFSVAKRVRTETKIASQAVSISYAAVELAKKIFGDLHDKAAMLIGAGEMAELSARYLIDNKIKRLIVVNRTLERAVELARELGGEARGLDEIEDALIEADIVISSTGAPNLVLTKDGVRRSMRPRRHRLLFMIDIAVPRDIDPDVNNIENVYLYDIDDLKGVVDENLKERTKEAKKAERMVEEEVIKFSLWLNTLDILPIIQLIQKKGEAIRQKEMERSRKKLSGLTDTQLKAIDVLTLSIVQKILNDPIVCLRKNCLDEDLKSVLVDAASMLFNLEQGPTSSECHS